MYIKYALLADYIAPGANGKTNIMGVFDKLYAKTFPTVHHSLSLLVKFELEPKEENKNLNLQIDFVDQDGKRKVAPIKLRVKFPSRKKDILVSDHQFVFELNKLKIDKPGTYEFSIYVNERYLYGVPLSVVRASR